MSIIFLYLAISLIFYGFGEYFSKLYSINPSWQLFVLPIILYAINAAAWLPAINHTKNLTITSMLWNVSYVIVGTIIGLAVFKESITIIQGVGLLLGFIAVILLNV